MKTYGSSKNPVTKLYAQLLGAKLSIADGSDSGPVADIISDADAFLADYDHTSAISKEMQETVLGWMSELDDYNNGRSGVNHCDDEEEDD